MTPISDDDFRDEADFIFIGNPDIKLPPKSTHVLGPSFFEMPHELSGVKFFAMTGHEHQLGTNVQVAMSDRLQRPRQDGLRRPGLAVERAEDRVSSRRLHGARTAAASTSRCSWNNTTDERGEVRRVGERRDVLLLGVLLPEPGRARVLPHVAARRRWRRRHLLPGRRALRLREQVLGVARARAVRRDVHTIPCSQGVLAHRAPLSTLRRAGWSRLRFWACRLPPAALLKLPPRSTRPMAGVRSAQSVQPAEE